MIVEESETYCFRLPWPLLGAVELLIFCLINQLGVSTLLTVYSYLTVADIPQEIPFLSLPFYFFHMIRSSRLQLILAMAHAKCERDRIRNEWLDCPGPYMYFFGRKKFS